MKPIITGIVVEYNPFHNGHIYHIEQARRITQCDVLIAVMSPNFVQRGEPALINKWQRTEACLKHGVDLVIELPTYYALQSAQTFAKQAVSLLIKAGITDLVYGSESLTKPILKGVNHQLLKAGHSYAKAKNIDTKTPNNILGAYYEYYAANVVNTHQILRTNHYHDLDLKTHIASASAIRHGLATHQDISKTTPMKLDDGILHRIEDYYPFIRYEIIKENQDLKSRFLVNEGIENKLYKEALKHNNYTEFLSNMISKRYTASRIRRTLMHILLHSPTTLSSQTMMRVLGFNTRGQHYLKKSNAPFVTLLKDYQYKDFEQRATTIYALPYLDTLSITEEKTGPIRVL